MNMWTINNTLIKVMKESTYNIKKNRITKKYDYKPKVVNRDENKYMCIFIQ